GRDRRDRTQRRAAEERHLDVPREAMDAEEPALALDAVQRRVPFHRLAHAGEGAHDERIEAAPDVAFPARHGRDVGLYRGVAVGPGDLRVAAREESRLRGRGGPLALPVQRNGGTDQVLELGLVDLVPLTDVDSAPDFPLEAGVEQT